ncbi:MAG TPA: hypothetical protein VN802_15165 [Stellaceae bacterium]|nr:hypothetical protein [Stellaceae bacterium]
MLAHEQMRWGSQIMAAMFGGPGIFYILESFSDAGNALNGIVYLALATALIVVGQGKAEKTAAAAGALARVRAALQTKKPRR